MCAAHATCGAAYHNAKNRNESGQNEMKRLITRASIALSLTVSLSLSLSRLPLFVDAGNDQFICCS